MSLLREQIEKEYGIPEKTLNEGIWFNPPGSNLEFLVRPATYHNKELQKKDLILNFKEKYGKDFFYKETPESREAVAELYHETVIIKYRLLGTEQAEAVSIEDLKWIFAEFPPVGRAVIFFCIEAKNFRIIEATDAKN